MAGNLRECIDAGGAHGSKIAKRFRPEAVSRPLKGSNREVEYVVCQVYREHAIKVEPGVRLCEMPKLPQVKVQVYIINRYTAETSLKHRKRGDQGCMKLSADDLDLGS